MDVYKELMVFIIVCGAIPTIIRLHNILDKKTLRPSSHGNTVIAWISEDWMTW